MSEPEVDHDDISDHILYHLRRMADDQHEGSELEVALRHAADRIERLLGHLNWLGWSDIDIEKHKAELEASRLGQKLLIAERDEAREAARMMVAARHDDDDGQWGRYKRLWPWLVVRR